MKSLRKILAISVILLSFSAFIFESEAQIEVPPPCDGQTTITLYPCTDDKGNVFYSLKERQDAAAAINIAAIKAAENGGIKVCPQSAYTSGVTDFLSLTKGLCVFIDFVLVAISSLFAGLMYVCAVLFDFSIDKFVLKISTFFLDSAGPGGNKEYIYGAWSVIRDLANIAAFFGAVYAGFLRIIGQNQEDFRKAIAKLILFALLTNFSFAISKFAIDMANVVSLQIYGAAANYKFAGNITGGSEGKIISDYGISTAYMQNMGIQGMVVDTTKVNPSSAFKNINSITVVFISIIFFIFAGWMFLKAAIFIIVRTFILIGAVIFSPLMFIGGLVPQLTKVHDKWRELFFGNLLVAPLIMIFIWISLQILGASYSVLGLDKVSTGSWAEVLAQTSLLVFGGLSLHLMVKFGEQASGAVGQFAVNVLGGAVGGVATAVATGGAGFVARAGAARAAAAASSVGKKWVEKENAGKIRKFAGGMLLKGGDKLEKTEIFGKSAFGARKAVEDKVSEKRNTVLRENRVAAKDLGWTDKLEQAKSEKEIGYIKDQLAQKKKYDSATHDKEIEDLKNKPAKTEIKSDAPRVLEKDKELAGKLKDQIVARDNTIDAQIKTEQEQLDAEYAGPMKTRLKALENLKLSKADPKEIENAQKFIDNLNKTLGEKKVAIVERLNKQKGEMVDYVGWKAELSGLEGEFSKTTMMYKAGAAIGSLNEKERQAGEKEMAAIKNAAANLPQKLGKAFSTVTANAFTTEFDKPDLEPGKTTFTDLRGADKINPVDKSIQRNADKVTKASTLRSKK